MSSRRLTVLRWVMTVVGVAVIVLTVAPAVYARLAGEHVGDGMRLPAGDTATRYLVASGQKTQCTLRADDRPPQTVQLPIMGPRELFDGTRIQPPPGESTLTCSDEQIKVTSGPLLTLYPLAEYDYIPIIGGAVLVGLARVVRPRKQR